MFFTIAAALVLIFVGGSLFYNTGKRRHLVLHETALWMNPVYRWGVSRFPRLYQWRSSLGRLFLRGVGLCCLAYGGFLFLAVFWAHRSPFVGEPFDPLQWQIAGSCQGLSDGACAQKEASCPRGGMVGDIRRNHLIKGVTSRAQIIAQLGAQEYTLDIKGQSCAAYSLGMCSGLGIDYDSLYVCFDAENRVSFSGQVQH